MSKRQQPRLLKGGLTGRVYVVTKYVEGSHGQIVANEKFDVTDDFNDLVGGTYATTRDEDSPSE